MEETALIAFIREYLGLSPEYPLLADTTLDSLNLDSGDIINLEAELGLVFDVHSGPQIEPGNTLGDLAKSLKPSP